MTRAEFDHWIDNVHGGCFPGVKAWLRKMDYDERKAVLGAWFGKLQYFTPEDCEQASNDLWGQDTQPKGFGQHPIIMVRMLRKKKHARDRIEADEQSWRPPVDGQITYKCLDCRDEGTIRCFHPKTVVELKRVADDAKIHPYRISRACTCKAGNKYERLLGRISSDDLRETYRDADGMLCWYDVNDSNDRVELLGVDIDNKEWSP